MKRRTKLSTEQQEQHTAAHQQTQHNAARDFATAEEVLRADAAQTVVPPGIAEKLQKSVAALPNPGLKPAWWKRFLGGGA